MMPDRGIGYFQVICMDEKGQTAVEYILLIGSVVFLVIIVFIVVKDKVFGDSGGTIQNNSNTIIGQIRNVTK
jgi:uncharacterized protein (UPF0333 family)